MNELSVLSERPWKRALPLPSCMEGYLQGKRASRHGAGKHFSLTQFRPKSLALKHIQRSSEAEWNELFAERSELAARIDQRVADRIREAAVMLRDSVEINARKRGGVPVFKGTRVPIALILAELANNANVPEIAEDLGLSEDLIRGFLEGMAIHFDRSFIQ